MSHKIQHWSFRLDTHIAIVGGSVLAIASLLQFLHALSEALSASPYCGSDHVLTCIVKSPEFVQMGLLVELVIPLVLFWSIVSLIRDRWKNSRSRDIRRERSLSAHPIECEIDNPAPGFVPSSQRVQIQINNPKNVLFGDTAIREFAGGLLIVDGSLVSVENFRLLNSSEQPQA